jgi:hypothetical protein
MKLHPVRPCRFLHGGHDGLGSRNVRILEQGNYLGLWKQLGKKLKALGIQLYGEEADAREVATRPSKTGDQAIADRVVTRPGRR